MNIENFEKKVEGLRKRYLVLRHSKEELPLPKQHLLQEAFKELYSALEELEAAKEELRQQHEQLRETQAKVETERQRYQDLFEFAPDGYLATDANGVIRAANCAAARLLNVKQQFLVGKPLVVFIPESERQAFRANLSELQDGEWICPLEVSLQPLKGVPFDAALTVATIRNSEGKLLALRWLLRDVTDRKRAELALRESEERYALAARGANDGLWDWNLKTNHIYFSTRWKSMLGCVENDIGNSVEEWFKRVHPTDEEQLKEAIATHLQGVTPHFENEHRMLHRDGQYRWMLSRGLAVRDSNEQPYRIAGSQTDITQRKQTESQLMHYALHDGLTGLPNRVLFMERLSHALKRAKRSEDYLFAVLFLDLNRFKVINDCLGHMRGDQLLIGIARRLEACLRPGDTVARLGGDEFTILLESIQNLEYATQVAERIQQELALPFNLSGHEVFASASIGIALSTNRYDQPEDLLRDADVTMYQAKAQGTGKARYEVFNQAKHPKALALLQLETDLRRALDRLEFRLQYQPIVALPSGRITGFEALVRWQHPERGLLEPAEFIPVAEETGLIVPIGWWVVREACRQMRAWQALVPEYSPLTINVNFSGKQFVQTDMVQQIESILHSTGLDACSLALEITETAIMENHASAAIMIQQLRELGVKLFLDDFGTGYSSLSYLHRFEFNTLKIDRSFVSSIGFDGENLEIVRTIVTLAHNLDMNVTAEGVETATQLAQLIALKCEHGQGYLFSKPVDCESAGALIAADLQRYGDLNNKETGDRSQETQGNPCMCVRYASSGDR